MGGLAALLASSRQGLKKGNASSTGGGGNGDGNSSSGFMDELQSALKLKPLKKTGISVTGGGSAAGSGGSGGGGDVVNLQDALKTDTLTFASRFKRAIPAAEKFTGRSETSDGTICTCIGMFVFRKLG